MIVNLPTEDCTRVSPFSLIVTNNNIKNSNNNNKLNSHNNNGNYYNGLTFLEHGIFFFNSIKEILLSQETF